MNQNKSQDGARKRKAKPEKKNKGARSRRSTSDSASSSLSTFTSAVSSSSRDSDREQVQEPSSTTGLRIQIHFHQPPPPARQNHMVPYKATDGRDFNARSESKAPRPGSCTPSTSKAPVRDFLITSTTSETSQATALPGNSYPAAPSATPATETQSDSSNDNE